MNDLPPQDCCPIVELRQYTLHPGKRDELVALFESAFIAPQEAAGMRVIGQFRDAGNADRFVWLRGFEGMAQRAAALSRFYTGPAWQAHRDQANATMADSDNVLLLRPAFPGGGFRRGATGGKLIAAAIHYFPGDAEEKAIREAARGFIAVAEQGGARVLAQYLSEKSPNTFPRLPVREHENVFVWFAAFETRQDHARWQAALPDGPDFLRPPEVLLLEPTARSLLR